MGWITGSERSPGGVHDNPLQCFCLENPMDREAWWDPVHRVPELETTKTTGHVNKSQKGLCWQHQNTVLGEPNVLFCCSVRVHKWPGKCCSVNLESKRVYLYRICEWWKWKESEVAQSCPTLCNPMDCSLPGSSIHGIFQARILEWVAISFSRGSSWPRDQARVSLIVGRRFTVWATREASGEDWL